MREIILIYCLVPYLHIQSQDWKFIETNKGQNTPYGITETYDGGFVFGLSNPANYNHLLFYKLDINGDLLWKRRYAIQGKFIAVTGGTIHLKNGGYILSGLTEAIDSIHDGDPFILKLDECWNPIWFKIYNEPHQQNRIEQIWEYNGKLLVNFAYLDRDYTTIALLNQEGAFMDKTTLKDLNYCKMKIRNDKLIDLIGYGFPAGLLADKDIGIQKSLHIQLDSNLSIKKIHFFQYADTHFLSSSYDFVYLDSSTESFITSSNHRRPNGLNKNIDGSVMMTKNLKDSQWKIISDTSTYNSGIFMVRVSSNRYAISGNYNPQANNTFWYYGKNYIIDSNFNIIHQAFENPGPYTSMIKGLLRTSDGNLLTIGIHGISGNNWETYAYKYNPDLTSFKKTNFSRNYDSLCSSAVMSDSIELPAPKIVHMNKDSFLSMDISKVKSVLLFPNPAINYIQVQGIELLTPLSYEIYDVQGQLKFKSDLALYFDHVNIDIQLLTSGYYVIKIADNKGGLRTIKFMKE